MDQTISSSRNVDRFNPQRGCPPSTPRIAFRSNARPNYSRRSYIVKQGQRFDVKLATILRTSSEVFAEKGYDRASVRDISAATEISLSGLYHYFSSKEELLFLIQKTCFDTLLEQLGEDLADLDSPVERLSVIVRNHVRFFVDNMAKMKVLSHEADALTGIYREEIADRKRAYVAVVHQCVEKILETPDAADCRVATFALFGMMNWIYTWYRQARDVSVDRLGSVILHTFLEGISSPLPFRGEGVAGAGPDGVLLFDKD